MPKAKNQMLNTKQVSEMFGIAQGTLSNWRYLKKGPKYYKITTRKICYALEDLDRFFKASPVLTADSLPEGEE